MLQQAQPKSAATRADATTVRSSSRPTRKGWNIALYQVAGHLDTKFISALLGHSRTSFTDATYVLLFPEAAKAAAESAAAVVPRRNRAAIADQPICG
jgi:integrase